MKRPSWKTVIFVICSGLDMAYDPSLTATNTSDLWYSILCLARMVQYAFLLIHLVIPLKINS